LPASDGSNSSFRNFSPFSAKYSQPRAHFSISVSDSTIGFPISSVMIAASTPFSSRSRAAIFRSRPARAEKGVERH